jgi:hypothetical protein
MGRRAVAAVVGLVVIGAVVWFGASRGGLVGVLSGPPETPAASAATTAPAPAGPDDIRTLFDGHRSDVEVQSSGTVTRILSDDDDGSRHQRFILRLADGLTVLVAHTIDIAPRLDGLRTGDEVAFRGEYEWSDLGGTVHWTHHDPDGRHEDGWLTWQGRTYA